jgi:hypothetical protein
MQIGVRLFWGLFQVEKRKNSGDTPNFTLFSNPRPDAAAFNETLSRNPIEQSSGTRLILANSQVMCPGLFANFQEPLLFRSDFKFSDVT